MVVAIIYRATGMEESSLITIMYSMYSKPLVCAMKGVREGACWQSYLSNVRHAIAEFRELVSNISKGVCKTHLYTLKVHLLSHMDEVGSRVDGLELLEFFRLSDSMLR